MAYHYDRLEHDTGLSEKLPTEEIRKAVPDVTTTASIITSILILSVLLNTFLILLGSFLYWHRGPSNPIFPQALYCKQLFQNNDRTEIKQHRLKMRSAIR